MQSSPETQSCVNILRQLSSYDDNRYVLEDGISTLSHGHYMIRDVHVEQDILDEPE